MLAQVRANRFRIDSRELVATVGDPSGAGADTEGIADFDVFFVKLRTFLLEASLYLLGGDTIFAGARLPVIATDVGLRQEM